MTVKPNDEKKQKMFTLCVGARRTSEIRELARLIGHLVACFPDAQFGKLHYRQMETSNSRALEQNRSDFNKEMKLSHAVHRSVDF